MYSSAAVKDWFSTCQSVGVSFGGSLQRAGAPSHWGNGKTVLAKRFLFGFSSTDSEQIWNTNGRDQSASNLNFSRNQNCSLNSEKITFRKENFEHFVLQNGRSYFHEVFRICRTLGHRTEIINLGVSPLIWVWRGANFSIGADVDSSFIFSMKWFFVVFAERWMTSAYRFSDLFYRVVLFRQRHQLNCPFIHRLKWENKISVKIIKMPFMQK